MYKLSKAQNAILEAIINGGCIVETESGLRLVQDEHTSSAVDERSFKALLDQQLIKQRNGPQGKFYS